MIVSAKRRVGLMAMAMAVAVVTTMLALSSLALAYSDRIERRSGELALPDDVLDPGWPELSPRVDESVLPPSLNGDSDDEMYLDEAERQELERYLVERGIIADPNAAEIPSPLGGDDQLDVPPEGSFGEEYSDPSDW